MRKKTIKNICSTIFWYVLYLLPVIAYLIYLFSLNGNAPLSLTEFLVDYPILTEENTIVMILSDIFGSGGILPFINDDSLFIILGWYVLVFCAHLLIDFVLFIPSYAHKIIKEFTDYD